MSIRDEFDFIKQITPKRTLPEEVIVGIGDDAAIVRPKAYTDMISCTDTMVENVHFARKTMSPYQIGHKALAANISDVAAMGGMAKYYLVSLVVPSHWKEEELVDLYRGMEELAMQHHMVLIGGDTVSTNGPLIVNVTVLGEITKGKSLRRSHARPGDVIFITGTVGDSAAGLHILLNDQDSNEYLLKRHQLPEPQVLAGTIMIEFERVAVNDISDGVASEAIEIAEASQVNMILEENLLPLSSEILSFGRGQAINWALYGGEDYQLIGCISEELWPELKQQFTANNIKVEQVGTVQTGTGQVFLKKDQDLIELKKQGYNHFKHGDQNETTVDN
ncbi:thiamine-phosphate kinase [Bacillus pinisoli]|uniref:thiamine-phosphate kinase n=1 Tax=Bacillus pinisoli TaxID=2901866 RepID=UPI001FF423C9|nr:thiamine-phosphate kinase [Bacillus pinisoli]